MGLKPWLVRIRSLDVRLLAAILATLLLIGGVMWIVPTTPESNSFNFDSSRRDLSDARSIAPGGTVEGMIVDGSDFDFYRIEPLKSSTWLDVHMRNGSAKLIPALLIIDSRKNVIVEKTAEYVRSPGTGVDCSFLAQANESYYIQIGGQRNTTGAYTLTVSERF